jgi:hypothetical protein
MLTNYSDFAMLLLPVGIPPRNQLAGESTMTREQAQQILDSGKEVFDLIEREDTRNGSARASVWKLRRDAREYISGEWQASPERAKGVIFEHLFTALFIAADLGIIEHQTDVEIVTCYASAIPAVIARIPVRR